MNRQMVLPIGKVDNHLLEEIVFKNTGYKHPLVLDRANIGDDTASIFCEKGLVVVSTDPITAATSHIGSLAINISCNDIATRGIRPVAITLAIMLPQNSTLGDLEAIMKDASFAAKSKEVEIVGGHTEVTRAVNKPIIVSTAMGFDRGISRKVAAEEDVIIMTKSAGIEGAGILAYDNEILSNILSEEELNHAKNFLNFTSVVQEGELAGKLGFVKMHDVTEGGILGGVWELCESLKLGCLIDENKIIVDKVVEKISNFFSIDYLKLISSGSMLIVVKKEDVHKFENEFREREIEYSVIGKMTKYNEKKIMRAKDNTLVEILKPERDELYKAVKL